MLFSAPRTTQQDCSELLTSPQAAPSLTAKEDAPDDAIDAEDFAPGQQSGLTPVCAIYVLDLARKTSAMLRQDLQDSRGISATLRTK
jgi:hypothetical protein